MYSYIYFDWALSYNASSMGEKERQSCVGIYCMEKGEHCLIATQIKHQAKHGSPNGWELEKWQKYIDRIRDNVLPLCEHPEELEDAIQNTQPELKITD